ncbi:tail completion protein gp17 [Sphingomonas sp. XXL09]|uniref:tail completion protein gp17 n=1 Tax=Sphingomonas sp. XXL09 TaxID=3457787 RepID=UPI00406BD878
MSGAATGAGTALREALVRRLAGVRVFDAPPARAALPYAVIAEPVLEAADAAGITGRSGTILIAGEDEGERPDRLRALLADVEAAVAAMPDALGDGWRLATLRLVRSRIAAGRGLRWTGSVEFAVRLYRADHEGDGR